MHIHSAERRVSLSAGELASFRLGPSGGDGAADLSGRWRMSLGSAWHESLRAELHRQFTPQQTELAMAAGQSATGGGGNAVQEDAEGLPSAQSAGGDVAALPDQPEQDTPLPASDADADLHDWLLPASAEQRPPEASSEVPLAVTFFEGGWRFELSGRIDQALHNPSAGRTLLREVKTTSLPLPADEALLRSQFPHYFRQLALYVYGWQTVATATTGSPATVTTAATAAVTDGTPAVAAGPGAETAPDTASEPAVTTVPLPNSAPAVSAGRVSAAAAAESVCGELCFVSIRDGRRQHIRLTASQAEQEARQAMQRLLPFLHERARPHQVQQGQRPALRAFTDYREGQEDTLHELRGRLLASPVTVFEAPTGFGKTGIALEAALEQLRSGVFSRVIYLSGKTTGQHQVMRQLRQMNAQGPWRVFQLRSKAEHVRQPLRQRAPRNQPQGLLADAARLQWEDFGVHPPALLDEQRADVDSLRQLAARTGLCPYELAKSCLPYADVWIGDYNYVFSPRNRRVFFDQPGFDPAQTLLIVDEVHNLPSRVADTLSLSLSASQAEATLLDLRLAQAPFLLQQAWEAWTSFLQGIKPSDELEPRIGAEAATLLGTLCERMQNNPIDEQLLQPFTREAMAEVFWQAQSLASYPAPRLIWSPRHGVLNISCLDAASFIGQTLQRFGASVLMSATVGPLPVFAESLGLQTHNMHLVGGPASWRQDAYEVAIDTTVDTRLRTRAQYYEKTAATIGRFAMDSAGPLTVFFPSYQYAEVVQKYLEALHPELIIKLQPRAIDPGGQLTFVEESLLLAHVLFFVLGSSFSESIDHLGGRVDRAMVVGPALPEVNPVQTAKLGRYEPLGREEAFRRVYQIPALQKINQALGRLVRAPGQTARVLLHDQRFAQNSYRSLLAPEYREAQILTNETDLRRWLLK